MSFEQTFRRWIVQNNREKYERVSAGLEDGPTKREIDKYLGTNAKTTGIDKCRNDLARYITENIIGIKNGD